MEAYLQFVIPIGLTAVAIYVLPERWRRFSWVLALAIIYVGNQLATYAASDLTGHGFDDSDHWGSAISGFSAVVYYALIVPGLIVIFLIVPVVLIAAVVRVFRRNAALSAGP